MKKVIIFIAAWLATYFIVVNILGIWGLFAQILSIVVALIVVKLFGSSGSKGGLPNGLPSDFNADYHSKNIAIDLKANKLWIRDVDGKTFVFKKSDILRWETEIKQTGTRRLYMIRCHVRSLDKPFHDIVISSPRWVPQEAAAKDEMHIWFSRLSTWIKNTD